MIKPLYRVDVGRTTTTRDTLFIGFVLDTAGAAVGHYVVHKTAEYPNVKLARRAAREWVYKNGAWEGELR